VSEKQKGTPKELYDFLNGRYFRNSLPDIRVVWSLTYYEPARRRHLMGSTWYDGLTGRPKKITLNPKYKTAFAVWAPTLIHEMVHVQQWRVPVKQAHGRKFEKRMKQLAARGAFSGLW